MCFTYSTLQNCLVGSLSWSLNWRRTFLRPSPNLSFTPVLALSWVFLPCGLISFSPLLCIASHETSYRQLLSKSQPINWIYQLGIPINVQKCLTDDQEKNKALDCHSKESTSGMSTDFPFHHFFSRLFLLPLVYWVQIHEKIRILMISVINSASPR